MTTPNTTPEPTGPVPSNTERAAHEALQRLRDTGSALPPGPAVPGAGEPSRNPITGQFEKRVGGASAPPAPAAAPAPEEATPPAGHGDATVATDPAEGEEDPAQLAPPAGDQAPPPAAEPAADPAEEGEEGEVPEGMELVELRGRRPDDPPYKVLWPKDDPEGLERLRQNVNDGARAEQVRAAQQAAMAAERQRAEVEELAILNPLDFLTRFHGRNVEALEHVALSLVTHPDIWGRIEAKVARFHDAQAREQARIAEENRSYRLRDSFQAARQQHERVEQNFKDVTAAIDRLTEGARDPLALQGEITRELEVYCERMDIDILDPHLIPVVIAPLLERHGIDPVSARLRLKQSPTASAPATARRPAAPAAPPAAPAASKPRTGKSFVTADARRRQAATVPGAGAGAPSGVLVNAPPPNQTTEQRIQWAREQAAKGTLLPR